MKMTVKWGAGGLNRNQVLKVLPMMTMHSCYIKEHVLNIHLPLSYLAHYLYLRDWLPLKDAGQI